MGEKQTIVMLITRLIFQVTLVISSLILAFNGFKGWWWLIAFALLITLDFDNSSKG